MSSGSACGELWTIPPGAAGPGARPAPSALRYTPGQFPKVAKTGSGSVRERLIELQVMPTSPWLAGAQCCPPSVVFCTP